MQAWTSSSDSALSGWGVEVFIPALYNPFSQRAAFNGLSHQGVSL